METIEEQEGHHERFFLRVRLCGAFHLEWVHPRTGEMIPVADVVAGERDRTAALSLLALLLAQPNRHAYRDWIMEQFWPDQVRSTASHRLENVFSTLRKLLRPPSGGESLLHSIRSSRAKGILYGLDAYPHLWADVDALVWNTEQAARMERFGDDALPFWERTFALLKPGPYLPDEFYAEWAKEQRERLDGYYRQCVHALWRLYTTRQGEAGKSEALLLLRTYWQQHKTDEDALRPLLELLEEQERYQEAEEYYQQLLFVLAELGPDEEEHPHIPDARTQDLAEYLRIKQRSRSLKHVVSAPLLQHSNLHRPDRSGSSLAHVVQLPQTVVSEQAPDEHGVFLPSQSGIVVLPEPSIQMLSLTTARIDLPTWFGLQVNDLKAIGASWQGSAVPYQQQQASIHAELERWNSMAEQDYQRTSDYLITRRTALATLATLSTRLLTRVQGGSLSAIVVEEFLRESTTAITASWELLNGNGLATVEYALPRYLPLLIKLAHQPSKYQQQAAYLGTQGSLIMSLVCYHRLHFQEDLAYARQAVEIAKIAKDDNLYVYTLVLLGGALNLTGQTEMMFEKLQEAAFHQKNVVPPLQSKLLAELALSHAQNGQVEAALNRMSEAHTIFPDTFGDVPGFISADYNIFQRILFEGMTHLALAKSDMDNVLKHSTQAQTALAQFGKLPSTINIPERTKIEIINHQAAAAVGTGNMEECVSYLQAGAAGAKALGSQKRKHEAIVNWKAARARWPHEKRVLDLADILME